MNIVNIVAAGQAATVEIFASVGSAIVNRGPIGWVRRLFNTVKTYHANMQIITAHVDEVEREVNEVLRYVKRATKVHVDVSATQKGFTQVVIIGQYRGRDYVNTFNLRLSCIDELIDRLTQMSRYAGIGRIDAPHNIDATIKHSLKKRGVF